MTSPTVPPPMCGSCGAYLQPPNHTCPVCGSTQWPAQPPAPAVVGQPVIHNQPIYYMQPPTQVAVPAKSAGVAVLLSFLWLGLGNLYVGQTALGVVLMILDIPLAFLAFTVIGFVVAFPLWLVLAIVAMVLAAQGANNFNQRNGILAR